jgi:hypothetical protein
MGEISPYLILQSLKHHSPTAAPTCWYLSIYKWEKGGKQDMKKLFCQKNYSDSLCKLFVIMRKNAYISRKGLNNHL